jgi:hypothetical protein
MKRLIVFLFSVLALAACGGANSELNQKLEKLNKELLDGHDVVMPKSMKLPKIKASVLELIKDLPEDDERVKNGRSIAFELTKANDDMYNWMDNYANARLKTEDPNSQLELYERLKEEIAIIGSHTNEAMEMADKFISENETAE